MEYNKINTLLNLYFQGETSLEEENELRIYFTSTQVAAEHEQYRSLFKFFTNEKEIKSAKSFTLSTKKTSWGTWLSIAASIILLISIYSIWNPKKTENSRIVISEYGTHSNPEVALKETKKALDLLSQQLNIGIESVHYLDEYKNSKQLIFKQ